MSGARSAPWDELPASQTICVLSKDGFRRSLFYRPGWDRRSTGGDRPNYGIHGAHMQWQACRDTQWPKAATHFDLCIGWTPTSIESQWDGVIRHWSGQSYGADLGYHSAVQLYEDQLRERCCQVLGGQPCYSGGSGLDAGDWLARVMDHGVDWIWPELETRLRALEVRIGRAEADLARWS